MGQFGGFPFAGWCGSCINSACTVCFLHVSLTTRILSTTCLDLVVFYSGYSQVFTQLFYVYVHLPQRLLLWYHLCLSKPFLMSEYVLLLIHSADIIRINDEGKTNCAYVLQIAHVACCFGLGCTCQTLFFCKQFNPSCFS